MANLVLLERIKNKIKEKKSGPTTPVRYCQTSGTVGSGLAKFNCIFIREFCSNLYHGHGTKMADSATFVCIRGERKLVNETIATKIPDITVREEITELT